jgi:hypothetical protein
MPMEPAHTSTMELHQTVMQMADIKGRVAWRTIKLPVSINFMITGMLKGCK